jgi:hypothetical protein
LSLDIEETKKDDILRQMWAVLCPSVVLLETRDKLQLYAHKLIQMWIGLVPAYFIQSGEEVQMNETMRLLQGKFMRREELITFKCIILLLFITQKYIAEHEIVLNNKFSNSKTPL